MRAEYDFSKGRRNPYAKRLKKRVTTRLDELTIEYFKGLTHETGIPYQTLINLYLRDCAASGRRLTQLGLASLADLASGRGVVPNAREVIGGGEAPCELKEARG